LIKGAAFEAILNYAGPVQIDIGIISAITTTPNALKNIANHEGTILSKQIGRLSKATAFVISNVHNNV